MHPHRYTRTLLKLASGKNRFRILAAWLLAGLLLGFVGFRIVSEVNRRDARGRLETALTERSRAFARELESSVNVVRSTAALFESRANVSREEFLRFVRSELMTQQTAAFALHWIPIAEAVGEHPDTRQTQREGSESYLAEPSRPSQSMLGDDLLSIPEGAAAIKLALSRRGLTLSEPIELIASPRVMGFLAMVPVDERLPDSSGQVRGIVVGIFRFEEIARDAFGVNRGDGADTIRVELTPEGSRPGSPPLFASHPAPVDSEAYWSGGRTIELGGQAWQLTGQTAESDHRGHQSWLPYWVGAGVFFLSQCIFGFFAVGTELIRGKAVTKQARLLGSVLRSLNDGVLVADTQGKVILANRMAQELVGSNFADLPPEQWSEHCGVYLPDEVTLYPSHDLPLARAIRGETSRETEVFIRNDKMPGGAWLSVNGSPLVDEADQVRGGVVVFRDVTARKAAEATSRQLELAAQVQSRFYTPTSRRIPGFEIEAAVFSADETCGDYFDFVEMPGQTTGLAVGDVCGHGISAALVMAETRALMRSTMRGFVNPGRAFTFINQLLVQDLEDHRYVTMLFARLDPRTGKLCFANAGHTPGFILDCAGHPRCSLGASGLPLGMFEGSDYGRGLEAELHPGELLVMLTDGVAETESPGGVPFGEDRVISLISEHREEPAGCIIEALDRAIRDYSGPVPRRDDVTIMICKRKDTVHDRVPRRRNSVPSHWHREEASRYVARAGRR